jgi:hypothetical protein
MYTSGAPKMYIGGSVDIRALTILSGCGRIEDPKVSEPCYKSNMNGNPIYIKDVAQVITAKRKNELLRKIQPKQLLSL